MLQPSAHEPAVAPGGHAAVVRRVARPDLDTTAELHVRCLHDGLFPRLGTPFVRRWHRTFLDCPHGSAHAAVGADGAVLAFLLGATDQAAYVRGTLRSAKWPLLWRGALGLARRPRLALTFVRTRAGRYARRLLGRSGSPAAAAPARVAVVHAIVTDERARGRGLGRDLLARFEADVAAAGVDTVELVTDEAGGAVEFYRRLGWTEGDTRPNRDGRRMVHFSKRVTP